MEQLLLFPDDDDYCPDHSFRRKTAFRRSQTHRFMSKLDELYDASSIHQKVMFDEQKKCSSCGKTESNYWIRYEVTVARNEVGFYCSVSCIPEKSTVDSTITDTRIRVKHENIPHELDDIF